MLHLILVRWARFNSRTTTYAQAELYVFKSITYEQEITGVVEGNSSKCLHISLFTIYHFYALLVGHILKFRAHLLIVVSS